MNREALICILTGHHSSVHWYAQYNEGMDALLNIPLCSTCHSELTKSEVGKLEPVPKTNIQLVGEGLEFIPSRPKGKALPPYYVVISKPYPNLDFTFPEIPTKIEYNKFIETQLSF